jgi:hypothetical protein
LRSDVFEIVRVNTSKSLKLFNFELRELKIKLKPDLSGKRAFSYLFRNCFLFMCCPLFILCFLDRISISNKAIGHNLSQNATKYPYDQ